MSTVTIVSEDSGDQEPITRYDLAYEVVASRIERRIRAGEFPFRSPLPSEPRLAEHYEVSRTTIRSSIRLLSDRGMVEVRKGKGTFVIWQEGT